MRIKILKNAKRKANKQYKLHHIKWHVRGFTKKLTHIQKFTCLDIERENVKLQYKWIYE